MQNCIAPPAADSELGEGNGAADYSLGVAVLANPVAPAETKGGLIVLLNHPHQCHSQDLGLIHLPNPKLKMVCSLGFSAVQAVLGRHWYWESHHVSMRKPGNPVDPAPPRT